MKFLWICVFLVAFLVPYQVLAVSSVSVTINATPEAVSINNTPSAFSFLLLAPNSTAWAKTGTNITPTFPLGAANSTFTIGNNGAINADVDISGGNLVGAGGYTWTLAAVQDVDQYKLIAGVEGTAALGNMITLTGIGQEMVSNLSNTPGSNVVKWELCFYGPTSFTSDVQVSGTILLSGRTVS